jgi:hypothetical protein
MPYSVKKRKCKDSKGDEGKFVITKKGENKKLSCHKSKEKAQAAVRARYANEDNQIDIDVISERVFLRLMNEYSKNQKKYAGSHPEESYVYGWPEYDEEWFDKEGLTTWHEDREWTKQYFKDMGMLK